MTNYLGQYIGEQFGNYRLIRLLGQGGYAEVYLAEHLEHQTQVAIKVFNRRHTDADNFRELLNELRISHLRHPHIVQIQDYGLHASGLYFLVMNYAPNGNLRQQHPRGTTVPLKTIVAYVQQIAAALQHAHDGKMIHRDVKPENMLVGPNHDILLGDFGIAVAAHSTISQVTEMPSGTAYYMAPEQIRGKPVPASDQYSLGVVVYEWLCGHLPFEGTREEVCSQHLFAPPPSLHERMPEIHPHIEHVVKRSLLKDPHHRFPSTQAFADELERVYLSIQPKLVGNAIYQPQPPLILAVPPDKQHVLQPYQQAHKATVFPRTSPAQQKAVVIQHAPIMRAQSTNLQPAPAAKQKSQSGSAVKKAPLWQESEPEDNLYRYACIGIISIDLLAGILWFVGERPFFWPIFLVWCGVMLMLDIKGLFFVNSRAQALNVALIAGIAWLINILLIELTSPWNGTLFALGVMAALVSLPTHLYLAHPLKNYSYKGPELREDTSMSI